jgi:2,3-dihydroxybiphenyl 1,2-dioxygenase
MEIRGLGYVGVGASNLSDWTSFATDWLGMQMIERGNTARAFRMDDRSQRLVVDRSLAEGERYFGFEVADAAALSSLASRLDTAGVAVRQEPKSLADQRFVKDLLSFDDPGGNRLEAFYGAAIADEPFRPGRSISGFRTGALGMGHVVFHVKNIDDLLGFYKDLLGFGVSDYISTPFRAYFLHTNPRHHSVALIETGKQDLHHLMVELYSLDDVGQGYDIALASRTRSQRRWGAIRTTRSPRIICAPRVASCWSMDGVAKRSPRATGRRARSPSVQVCGATTGRGSRRTSASTHATCA